jgi:hypothetical protein
MSRAKKRRIDGQTTRQFRPHKTGPGKHRHRWVWFLIAFVIFAVIAIFYREILPGEVNLPFNENSSPPNRTESLSQNSVPADSSQTDSPEVPALAIDTVAATNAGPAAITPRPVDPLPKTIQVEVLNGCGVAGMAAKLAEYLRKQEIDVVKTGNYRSMKVKNTQVIDRVGNPQFAEQIGELLGVNRRHIYTETERRLLVDATIIIGLDYNKIKGL